MNLVPARRVEEGKVDGEKGQTVPSNTDFRLLNSSSSEVLFIGIRK